MDFCHTSYKYKQHVIISMLRFFYPPVHTSHIYLYSIGIGALSFVPHGHPFSASPRAPPCLPVLRCCLVLMSCLPVYVLCILYPLASLITPQPLPLPLRLLDAVLHIHLVARRLYYTLLSCRLWSCTIAIVSCRLWSYPLLLPSRIAATRAS